VTSRLQASVSAGSVASASAAMATSTSGYRWKSWKLPFEARSSAVMLISFVPGLATGLAVRNSPSRIVFTVPQKSVNSSPRITSAAATS
jgi:hypothetical protein